MEKKKFTLARYLYRQKRLLLIYILSTIFLAVVAPLKSYILQWLLDASSKEAAIRYLFIGIGVVLLSHILEWFSRNSFTKMICKSCMQIRSRIMYNQTMKDMKTYLSEDTGDILSCLTNDLRIIYDEYYMSIFNIAMWGSMMIVAMFMIGSISPLLLVISMLLGMAPLIVPRILAKKMAALREEYSRMIAQYTTKTGELLKGFEPLLVSGAFGYFIKKHDREAARVQNGEYRTQYMMNVSAVVSSFVAWIPNITVLLFGVFMVYEGKLTMGYLVTAHSLSNFVITPARMVSNAYAKWKASRAIRDKLEDRMNVPEEQENGLKLKSVSKIELKDLSFTYPGAVAPALKHIDLSFRAGEKTALVGGSGSGKSTIAKILCKYFDSYEGHVLIDGHEAKEIDRGEYYQRVTMIPQSPFIFSDSIYNNLCLYQDFDKRKVEEAIRLAGLKEFIDSQPDGFETTLSENGKNLSGGQVQRLAIARAILRDCDFLIVDEATSSLDVKTTHEVMENLLGLPCSMIIITHDILGNYMKEFDTVCYLEHGRLKEKGSFDELLDNKAGFEKLLTGKA